MSKADDVIGGIFGWIIGLFIFGYFVTSPMWEGYKDMVTTYERYCSGFSGVKISDCKKENISTVKTVYRAIPEAQAVIVSSYGHIDKLESCAVFDRKNWKCENDFMKDGSFYGYYSDTKEYRTDYYHEIPRFLYIYDRIKNFF